MIKACFLQSLRTSKIKVFRKFLNILPDDPPLVETIFYAVLIMCKSLCCEVDK